MIEHKLANNNENTTASKSKKFHKLNMASKETKEKRIFTIPVDVSPHEQTF